MFLDSEINGETLETLDKMDNLNFGRERWTGPSVNNGHRIVNVNAIVLQKEMTLSPIDSEQSRLC